MRLGWFALAFLGALTADRPLPADLDRQRAVLRAFCDSGLVGLDEAGLRAKVDEASLMVEEDELTSGGEDARRGYESTMFIFTLRRLHVFDDREHPVGRCDVIVDTQGIVDSVELLLEDQGPTAAAGGAGR